MQEVTALLRRQRASHTRLRQRNQLFDWQDIDSSRTISIGCHQACPVLSKGTVANPLHTAEEREQRLSGRCIPYSRGTIQPGRGDPCSVWAKGHADYSTGVAGKAEEQLTRSTI
jgi:hypothetical protein